MSTIQLIDPRGSTPRDWCDRMALELDQFGTIPILDLGMTWKEWGREILQLHELSVFNPPNPDEYEDDEFEDWSIDFNDAVFAGD